MICWQQPYCIAMANHYITTQSSAPPYRVSAMLLPHSSCSLLLKPIPFAGVAPPQHTLPAYELTCASVLSGYIDSLIAAHTRSRRCHYVPRPTAVNCFALPLQVSQQGPTMPRRRCPGCTPSQRMQLGVSRPLIKVLLNFPTPLSPVPPSFPPIGEPQSIVGVGSVRGEWAEPQVNRPAIPAFVRPLQALLQHSPSSSPAPAIFLL